MKKFMILVLVFVLMATALVGCRRQEPQSSGSTSTTKTTAPTTMPTTTAATTTAPSTGTMPSGSSSSTPGASSGEKGIMPHGPNMPRY